MPERNRFIGVLETEQKRKKWRIQALYTIPNEDLTSEVSLQTVTGQVHINNPHISNSQLATRKIPMYRWLVNEKQQGTEDLRTPHGVSAASHEQKSSGFNDETF